VIDLEKKFEPTLLNTAIYLLGLSQQVSTFVLNFQVSGRCNAKTRGVEDRKRGAG
jgi:hypothetical protein